MGTRSITRVHCTDKKSPCLVKMYRQMDGYFDGMGQDLADFLDGFTIVKGFGSSTPEKAANGMECLAAQLVKHFKDGIGGIYLTVQNTEEYIYDIYIKDGKLKLDGVCSWDKKRKSFKINSTVMPDVLQ